MRHDVIQQRSPPWRVRSRRNLHKFLPQLQLAQLRGLVEIGKRNGVAANSCHRSRPVIASDGYIFSYIWASFVKARQLEISKTEGTDVHHWPDRLGVIAGWIAGEIVGGSGQGFFSSLPNTTLLYHAVQPCGRPHLMT
jgi:hypothetical protein